MNPNFIVLLLCDNDFGQELEQAAHLIGAAFGEGDIFCSEARVKAVVIDLMVGLCNLRRAVVGFADEPDRLREYLEAKLRVEFTRHPPHLDHDGGSVAIDRTRHGYAWRF